MLKPFIRRKRNLKRGNGGFSVVELLIASVVLIVGMLGSLVLVFVAIAGNSRNRTDSTGTMVSQLVMEQINTVSTNSPTTFVNITDCPVPPAAAGAVWTINVTDTNAGAGTGAGLMANGRIDFTQAAGAVPAGYQMNYRTCGGTVYDVRWHIRQGAGLMRTIIVSSRRVGATSSLQLFSPPITLRTISGP